MKELYEILQNFEKNKENMDFNEDFRLIQASMNHCNEFVKNFSKIQFRGGYEPYIEEIVLRLLQILRPKGYTTKINDHNPNHFDELRKITFFLILNTDVSYKFDLKDDHTVCHLLNSFPQMSRCLLLNVIWGVNLGDFYYDCLKYAPSWFIFQFLEETLNSLKYAKPYEVLERVESIVKSIYINICRMDYRPAANQVDKKIILSKLFDHIMNFLRHFNTPDSDKKIFNSNQENHKYLGFAMKSILNLVLDCFDLFQNKPEFEVDRKFNIFKLMLEKEPEADNHSNSYSTLVDDHLKQINVALLNTLQNVVVSITLDIFIDWVEIDMPEAGTSTEDDEEITLQKVVGESAYRLINLINVHECFQHDVVKQLECLAIKPKELKEKIQEATIGTILTKIENDKANSLLWYNELLSRGECVFGNMECLGTILDYVSLLSSESFKLVVQEYKASNVDKEDDEFEKFHGIFNGFLETAEKKELLKTIKELLENYGTDFNLDYTEDELILEITNFTNKFTKEGILRENYATIIVKNPKFFYRKLLERLEENDQKQNEIIVHILKDSQEISRMYLQRFLDNLIPQFSKIDSKVNFLLSEIFKAAIIDRKDFLKDILVKHIGCSLKSENYKLLLILINTFKSILPKLKTTDSLPPVLVLLSHVLDQCRWDLVKYTQLLDSIVEATIFVVQELVKIVIVSGTAEDKNWVLERVKNSKLLTKYYFQKLGNDRGEEKKFDDFLHPQKFEELSKEKIIAFLCENFVRCTGKESKWLGLNETLQPHFSDCLRVITTIVQKAGNQGNPLNCLRKCILDYIKILKDVIITSKTDQQELLDLGKDTLKLYKLWPKEVFGDMMISVAEVVREIAITIDRDDVETFSGFMSGLGTDELKQTATECLKELKNVSE